MNSKFFWANLLEKNFKKIPSVLFRKYFLYSFLHPVLGRNWDKDKSNRRGRKSETERLWRGECPNRFIKLRVILLKLDWQLKHYINDCFSSYWSYKVVRVTIAMDTDTQKNKRLALLVIELQVRKISWKSVQTVFMLTQASCLDLWTNLILCLNWHSSKEKTN